MDKKLAVVVVVAAAAICAGFAFLLLEKDTATPPAAPAPPANVTPSPSTGDMQETPGTYVDYNEQQVAQTGGTKILFFHAAWCPQCRELETDIKAGRIPSGVTIFKVDYDTNQALRQKYGVRLQTTLVKIDDNGDKIEAFVAYDNPSLQAVIENLL